MENICASVYAVLRSLVSFAPVLMRLCERENNWKNILVLRLGVVLFYQMSETTLSSNQITIKYKIMKITLNTYQIADELRKDSNAGWSYAGANALAEYLDENAGEETEFDCVAIRCDFSEYSSAQDAAEAYGWKADSHIEEDGAECDSDALQWLQDRAQVIEFSGGVIVSNF